MGAVTNAFESIGNVFSGAVDAVSPVIEAGGDYVASHPTVLLGPAAGAIGAGAELGEFASGGFDLAGGGTSFVGAGAGTVGGATIYDGLTGGAGNTLQMAAPVAQSAVGYGASTGAFDTSGWAGSGIDGATGTVPGGASYMQQLLAKAKANPFQALNSLGSIVNTGTSLYGMTQAQQMQQAARSGASPASLTAAGQQASTIASGPWVASGGQANAASILNSNIMNPDAYYDTPEYKAATQAVMRKMAAYGNSGNLATALQQSASAGRNAYLQQMGQFAGVGNNNAAAAGNLALTGQTSAATLGQRGQLDATNLAVNSLGLAGKTAVAATNNNNNWWS